ncbi:MAG: tetratricopeptide repeat protein [candidate division Zixibacteria bacterium]|nr:tetratricopeptide repeat protein [candidate division Zixibacteria bacterium]
MRWGDVFKSFLFLFLIFGFLSCANKEKQAEKHFKKGFEYQNQGNLDKALEEYQKALQLNPNYTQVYTNVGTVYLEKKDYDQAILQFKKVIELNHWDTKAHYNLGFAYLKKGEVEKAQEEVKFLKSIRSELGDVLEKKIGEK